MCACGEAGVCVCLCVMLEQGCVCVCVHACVYMCGVWGDVRKLWGRVIEKPLFDKEHLPKLVIIP